MCFLSCMVNLSHRLMGAWAPLRSTNYLFNFNLHQVIITLLPHCTLTRKQIVSVWLVCLSHTHTQIHTLWFNIFFFPINKMTNGYITIHLYGNVWVPFPVSSLVGLTDTSASTQSRSQTKLFLWTDHYTRAARGNLWECNPGVIAPW